MSKHIEEERGFGSCRVRRTAQARIAKNSQMPSDFFPDNKLSAKILPKTRCRDIYCEKDDKKIFQEFVSMFKMGKSLKSLALKLKPIEELTKDYVYQSDTNKENLEMRLPSLYINSQPSYKAKNFLSKHQKHKTL